MDQSPSKRVRVGGPDFLESQAGLPDGPANWQQLINLPGELFQVCIAPEFDGGQGRRDRLEALLSRGLLGFSFFAGKGSAATALEWLKILAKEAGFVFEGKDVGTVMACESSSECIKLLTQHMHKDDDGDRMVKSIQHVFGPIEHLVDETTQDLISSIRPAFDGSMEPEDIATRLATMKEYLYQTAAQHAGTNLAFSWCYNHDQMCPCFANGLNNAGDLLPGDIIDSVSDSDVDERPSLPKSPEPSEAKADSPSNMSSWVACTVFEGGQQCVDFAAYGKKRCMVGPSAVGFYVFTGELLKNLPKTFITEITVPQTAGLMQQEVGHVYNVLEIEINPPGIGKPKKRPRRYTFGWLLRHVLFSGSAQDFWNLFGRKVILSGEIYFTDEETRKEETFEMARKQQNFLENVNGDLEVANIPWEYLMKPRSLEILDEHLAHQAELQGSNGAYIFDVEQTFGFCKGGPFVPCQVTHGTMVSARDGKIMTSWESLVVQGEPCLGEGNELPCFIKGALYEMSGKCRKHVAGNAYDLDVFFAFFVYCMSNVSIREAEPSGSDGFSCAPPSAPAASASSSGQSGSAAMAVASNS